MISSIQSTLSAIKSLGKIMGVIADNVANISTEGFNKRRSIFVEGPGKNVKVEITPSKDSGSAVVDIKEGRLTKKEMSNGDLAEEIPQTIIAQRGYEVNLVTIRTQDEMLESIIDIIK